MQNMEIITHSLSWTLLHSLWQAPLIGLLLFLSLRVLPQGWATWRYSLAGVALVWVLLAAFGTFWRQINALKVNLQETLDADADLHWTGQLTQFFNQQAPVLMTLWVLGLAFFLLRLAWGLWSIGNLKKNADSSAVSSWQLVFEKIASQLGLSQQVILAESSQITTPLTLSWLKPMVLVPAGLLSGLSKEQVEAVFAHELAHVLRRDYLFNLLQTVVECIFYFNPAVWYISAVIRLEREHCCDDLVLASQGNALVYAKTLLFLQEWQKKAAPQLALGAIGTEKPLLRRIQRILQSPSNTSDMLGKLSLGSMVLLVLGALTLQSMRAPKPLAPSAVWARDTVPAPSGERKINLKNYKGKNVWLALEKDQIKNLQIDGKTIDPADYPKYQDLIENLRKITPPPPPAPPAPGTWIEVPAPAPHPSPAPAPMPAPKGKLNEREMPAPPPAPVPIPGIGNGDIVASPPPPPPPPPAPKGKKQAQMAPPPPPPAPLPTEAEWKEAAKQGVPPPPPPPPPTPKKGKKSPQ